MNILQLKQYIDSNPGMDIKKIYPDLKIVGGVREIVQFPTTTPRHILAKEFSYANCLKNSKAKLLYEEYSIKGEDNIAIEEWDEIGEIEGLPLYEPIPLDVERRLKDASERAGSNETVFEQNFVDTVIHVLEGAQTNNNLVKGVNSYTLLEGEAGAAKSKSISFAAAALQRPLYTIDCMGKSVDLLVEELKESKEVAGKASHAAKELAYLGGLNTPKARREYISLIEEYRHFEAIPESEWVRLASIEGIEDRTPYTKPGAAKLARRYGGVLNFEEINTLTPEALTVLNAELDVYSNSHPNFYVTASMNPAGDNYSNRSALTGEIRDRLKNSKEVTSLDSKGLKHLITGMLTGESPEIVVDNKKVILKPEDFGIKSSGGIKTNLLQNLTEHSRDTLINNLVKMYQHLQIDIKSKLDPRVSGVSVSEMRVVSLRTIGHFVNTLSSALSDNYKVEGDIWEKVGNEAKLDKLRLAGAISTSIDRAFKRPLIFMAQATEFENASIEEVISTERHLEQIEKNSNLDIATLTTYIELEDDADKKLNKIKAECKEKHIEISDDTMVVLKKVMERTERSPFMVEEKDGNAVGAFGKLNETTGSLFTIHRDAKDDGMHIKEFGIEKLKNYINPLKDYLEESGFKGVYLVPHILDGKKAVYALIHKDVCVDPEEMKGTFKVNIIKENMDVEAQTVKLSGENSILLETRPETGVNVLIESLIKGSILRDDFVKLSAYILPIHNIELGKSKKKIKEVER